jgi:hypothetical protein
MAPLTGWRSPAGLYLRKLAAKWPFPGDRSIRQKAVGRLYQMLGGWWGVASSTYANRRIMGGLLVVSCY